MDFDLKICFQMIINYYSEFNIFEIPNVVLTLRRVSRDLNSYQFFDRRGLISRNWLKLSKLDSIFGMLGGILMTFYDLSHYTDQFFTATASCYSIYNASRSYTVVIESKYTPIFSKLRLTVEDDACIPFISRVKGSERKINITQLICDSPWKIPPNLAMSKQCCLLYANRPMEMARAPTIIVLKHIDCRMAKFPNIGLMEHVNCLYYVYIAHLFLDIFRQYYPDDPAIHMLSDFSAHFFCELIIAQHVISVAQMESVCVKELPLFGYVLDKLCFSTERGLEFDVHDRHFNYLAIQDLLTGRTNNRTTWNVYGKWFINIQKAGTSGILSRNCQNHGRFAGTNTTVSGPKNYGTIRSCTKLAYAERAQYDTYIKALITFLAEFEVIEIIQDNHHTYEVVYPVPEDFG
jgi:hypothetical protein